MGGVVVGTVGFFRDGRPVRGGAGLRRGIRRRLGGGRSVRPGGIVRRLGGRRLGLLGGRAAARRDSRKQGEDTSSSLLDIQEEGSGSWTAQAHRKHAEASRKPMRRTRGFRMPFRPFRKIARRLCPGVVV